MSSVRLSTNLRHMIQRNATSVFQQSIGTAQQKLADDYYNRLNEVTYQTVLGHYNFSSFPSSWFVNTNIMTVTILPHILIAPYVHKNRYILTSTSIKEYNVPKISELLFTGSNTSILRAGEVVIPDKLYQEYDKFQGRIKKIELERDEFNKELKQILNRCNTLKQCLDAWPQGESLVPSEYIRRLNQLAEKREKPERVEPTVATTLSTVLIKRTLLNK